MSLYCHNDRRRGSVSVIGIVAILFFIVVLAAIMPMTNAELKFATMNRDNIEAGLAAEAGAKRAIAEMLAENTDWAWLEDVKGTADNQDFITGKAANYSVWVEEKDSSPATRLANGRKPTIGKTYTIISTGTVNGAKKKISVNYKMKAAAISGSLTDSTVYVQSLDGDKGTFYGKIVVGSEEPEKNKFTYEYEGEDEKPEWGATGLKFPKYDYEKFKNDKTEPIPQALPNVSNGGTYNLAHGKYYVDNGLTIPKTKNGTVLNLQRDTIIMINGDFNINANNFEITAETFIDKKDGLTKHYALLLVVFGDIDDSERNNPSFDNTVLVSLKKKDANGTLIGGNISFKNNVAITGLVIAESELFFKNNADLGGTEVNGEIRRSDRDLAAVFNGIAGGYETGGGETVSSGEAEISNWASIGN